MNFLPLWQASVCPTNSGRIVERRDQVLITFFSFLTFIASTFFSRWVSVNGPFFTERPISLFLPLLCLAAYDEFVGALVVTSLEAACRLAPRRHPIAAARRLPLAAALPMV